MYRRRPALSLIALFVVLLLVILSSCNKGSPPVVPGSSSSPGITDEPTISPGPTDGPDATETSGSTTAPSQSPDFTPGPSPSASPDKTGSPSQSPGQTLMPTATPKPTLKPTSPPGPTPTPVFTPTPSPKPTATPNPTPVTGPLNRLHSGSDFFSPVLGLCEDYPKGTSVNEIEKDFALMAEYGIKDIRVSIAWGDYERYKGYENWKLLDDKVRLAEKYGIELYPYICYSPSWATGGNWNRPPKDIQDWYDFVYRVVNCYKGRISHWELWNEGDNRDFWTGTWEQQLELVKTGARAVKAADPDAVTIFGGLTNKSPSHIRSIYTSGVADYIDVINVHFYNGTWEPKPIESIYSTLKGTADVIRQYGGRQELWVAEIGYSDYVQPNGKVSDWVSIKYPYEKTKHFQGVTFVRAFSQIAATEDVSTVLWYEIKNLRLDSPAIGDVNNHFLGALDHNRFPKHLWFAIASVNQLFADPYKNITNELTIESTGSGNRYVYGFKRENGDALIVAWNTGSASRTIKVTVPGVFTEALRHSTTGVKSQYEFYSSGGKAALTLELEPDNVHIIELFAGSRPERLTLSNPRVEETADGSYRITATAANIGGKKAAGVIGEIIVNPAITLSEPLEQSIGELMPGSEVELSWNVKLKNPGKADEAPQLWICVKDDTGPPAAVLVELD